MGKFEVANLQIVRDCRALAASWKRKNPEKSTLQTLQKWLLRASSVYPYRGDDSDWTTIHYEKAVADPNYLLGCCEKVTNLDYSPEALEYWRHQHHLVVGNGSTVKTVASFQREKGGAKLEPIYHEFLERAKTVSNATFDDRRWEAELSGYDRYLIDLLCGEENAKRGYSRDQFDAGKRKEYLAHLKQDLNDSDFSDPRFDFVMDL